MSETQNPTDPWPVLRERAQTGQLEFEPDAAYEAAELASAVIGELRAIRLVAEQVEENEPVSNLSSGSTLASRFAMKGSELHRLLGSHIGILEDMVDTFVAAGRTYAIAEGENADSFDDLSVPERPTELPGGPPERTAIPGPLDSRSEYSVPADGTAHDITPQTQRLQNHDAFDVTTVTVESAANKSYEFLYELGQSIADSSSPQRTANWSGIWEWMADQLRETFLEFINRMDSVTAEQWRGAGGEAAVASVHNYTRSMSTLWESMRLMGDNLAYTSGWLEATRVSMPQEAENPAGTIEPGGLEMVGVGVGNMTTYSSDTTVVDPTPQYRRNMYQTYGSGLPWSMRRLPTLPEPQVMVAGIDIPTQPNGSGGSGGTGGTAAGSGGAAPAAATGGAPVPGVTGTGRPVSMSTPTPRYPDGARG
ncbi:hypothetical protein, partial [Nocardia sp. CC216A]|uniref:hypothetical protein n=2 Tax=unclassified Nocardia TaxID=2637762 RepID=UPI002795E779